MPGRYQSKGRLECGFRVIRGEHAGLAHRWWAGIATLSPPHAQVIEVATPTATLE